MTLTPVPCGVAAHLEEEGQPQQQLGAAEEVGHLVAARAREVPQVVELLLRVVVRVREGEVHQVLMVGEPLLLRAFSAEEVRQRLFVLVAPLPEEVSAWEGALQQPPLRGAAEEA